MESVGKTLRDARVRLGLTLDQVSADTRISLKNLNAIEADDLSRLSSPFFYRSFVRQFAAKLQLNYESIAGAVQEAASTMPEPLVPGQEEVQLIHVPRVRRKRAYPSMRWLSSVASFCVVLALCTGLYTIWQQSPGDWHKLLSQVASHLPTAKATSAAATPISRTETPAAPLSNTPIPPQAKAAIAEQPAATPAADSDSDSTATVGESIDAGIHVQLAAIEASWLSIVADGKEIFSGVLDVPETKVLEGHDSARIRIGNAGGLSFTFNGKDLGVLGPRGQVRTVLFTRDTYKVIPSSAQMALSTFIQNGE
ncbi:MAG: DUF4115 domain-containing protein [Acidobacteriaceae bacterium]|nr:DUF4115 domain-containing protein [Acidobacteriaceae bacterium]